MFHQKGHSYITLSPKYSDETHNNSIIPMIIHCYLFTYDKVNQSHTKELSQKYSDQILKGWIDPLAPGAGPAPKAKAKADLQ